MGKNGKLRCLFGLNKTRASSPSLDKKLPKLLHQCPIQPNQYYRSGQDQSDLVRSDQKPTKIEPNGNTQPMTQDQIGAEKKVENGIEETMTRRATNRTQSKIELPDSSEKEATASSSIETISNESPERRNSLVSDSNNDCSFHPYEKLIPPDSHRAVVSSPPFLHATPSPTTTKVYEKEFVPKKIKPTRRNNNNQDFCRKTSDPVSKYSAEHASFKLGASGACKVVASSMLEEASHCSCDHCHSPRVPVEECDWGWLINTPMRPESVESHEQSTSRTCRGPGEPCRAGAPRYVNDFPTMQSGIKPNAEVAFTVREKGGKSFLFTIVDSGIQVHATEPTRDVTTTMTSSHRADQEIRSERLSHTPSVSTELTCDRFHHHHNGILTMAPRLAIRSADSETQHALHGKSSKPMKTGDDFVKREEKMSSRNSPQFELSKASYSKLLAYCGPSKPAPNLTPDGQSEPMHANQQFQPVSTGPSCSRDFCRLGKVMETVEDCAWYWGRIGGQESKKVLQDAEPGTFLLRDSSDPRYLFSLSVKTRQGPTSIRIVYSDGTFRFDSEMDDTNSRRGGRSADHPNYVKRLTPVFTCVINMVLFYTKHLGFTKPKSRNSTRGRKEQCQRCSANSTETLSSNERERSVATIPGNGEATYAEQFMCYWVNRNGRQEIPVLLSKPLLEPKSFPSLQRLCRHSLNVSQKLWANEHVVDQLPLPNSLKKYIKKYPYPV